MILTNYCIDYSTYLHIIEIIIRPFERNAQLSYSLVSLNTDFLLRLLRRQKQKNDESRTSLFLRAPGRKVSSVIFKHNKILEKSINVSWSFSMRMKKPTSLMPICVNFDVFISLIPNFYFQIEPSTI